MKKTILALAALATLSFTACQKEESFIKSFKGSTELYTQQGAKTQLAPDGHNIYWQTGDVVTVVSANGDFQESTYIASVTPDNPIDFALNYSSGYAIQTTDIILGMIYPSSINNAGTFTFPAVRQSSDGGISGIPMLGRLFTSNSTVRFYQLTGLLKLNITKAGITVDSITVTTNKHINGVLGQDLEDHLLFEETSSLLMNTYPVATEPYFTSFDPTHATNTLKLTTPQDITTAKNFYIGIPEGEFSTFNIRIFGTNSNGQACVATMIPRSTITIERAKITTVTAGPSLVFSAVDPS